MSLQDAPRPGYWISKRPTRWMVECCFSVRTPVGMIDVVFGKSGAVTTRVRFSPRVKGYSRHVQEATRIAKAAWAEQILFIEP